MIDKEKRTITITDHGVGMSEEELETNLGTIAHSGSLDYKAKLKEEGVQAPIDDLDIIGQFGVGFYSAFMVSTKVDVFTKGMGEEAGYLWSSDGVESYTLVPHERKEVGTSIVLHLKESDENEEYDRFLDEVTIIELIQKHSDYIRYPIQLLRTKSRLKEGTEDEYEEFTVNETLNSMTPLWKRRKAEVSPEEYTAFYQSKFSDFSTPVRIIHTASDGLVSYEGLLFIPGAAPFNYGSKDYQKGLQLYTNGVLIMDKAPELLPDYFSFVRGVVDSQDLSLNISREILQQDRQLKSIAKHIEKKIRAELADMLATERESYEKFFEQFGISLKLGIYENFGAQKEQLQDLLLYRSSHGESMTSLAEYRERMPEGQNYIYYACSGNLAQLQRLPSAERVLAEGYEILYMTDEVDEFLARILATYNEKELRSLADADLGLDTQKEIEELGQKAEEHKDLFEAMLEALDGKVHAVKLSTRLKTHPVWLGTQGEITLEMEKMFATMPNAPALTAQRVLELNAEHPVFDTLNRLFEEDREKLKIYAEILYGQAILLGGLVIENPATFTDAVLSLL